MASKRFNPQSRLQYKLCKAARSGNTEEMNRLVLQGADPFLADEKGMIAVQYWVLMGQGEGRRIKEEHLITVFRLLRKAGVHMLSR